MEGEGRPVRPVPSIVDSLSWDAPYVSVTDRYFAGRLCPTPGGDHRIMFHTNRICLVTLAPSHPFFSRGGAFSVRFRRDDEDNAVRGKSKRGGRHLEVRSPLCRIAFADGGDEYDVSACIRGRLMEVNGRLAASPDLLRTSPDSEGFVAAVLADARASDARKEELPALAAVQ